MTTHRPRGRAGARGAGRPPPRVLCVGEVLWDLIGGREHLGGAPCNVAAHLARLGCRAAVLTRVGDDPRGRRAAAAMRRLGIDLRWLQIDPAHETGWAGVALDAAGVPSFRFAARPAYDFIRLDAADLAALRRRPPAAVVFGTLAQRGQTTRRSLSRLLRALPPDTVTVYDINIRRDFAPPPLLRACLRRSRVVKLNDAEAPDLGRRLWDRPLPDDPMVRRLGREFGVGLVLLTRGAKGASVYVNGRRHDIPGRRVRVADTVGAGDAFTAAFLAHFLQTGDAVEAARRGNLLGAWVASRPGAVPELDGFIRRFLFRRPATLSRGRCCSRLRRRWAGRIATRARRAHNRNRKEPT